MALEAVKKMVLGASGVVGVEAVDQVAQVIPNGTSSGVELVIQIVIGLATVFGLFKGKKSKTKSKNTKNS